MNAGHVFGALSIAAALAILIVDPAAEAREGGEARGGPPSKQQIEIVGFSDSGREVVLRIVDENIGTLFHVRDTRRNELVKAYPFREDAEKAVWRRVKRAHDVADEFGDGPDNPRKPYTLMTAVKGGSLVIYMMKGKAIDRYDDVELKKSRNGEPAEAFVKQMAWGPRGKHAAVVYHQKYSDPLEWEGDFVHAFDFKTYRVDLDED